MVVPDLACAAGRDALSQRDSGSRATSTMLPLPVSRMGIASTVVEKESPWVQGLLNGWSE